VIAKVPDTGVAADLDACAAWAAKNGGDGARLGITGFCWGGRQVWLYAAHNPALKAGVAWYGRIDGEVNDRTPKYPLDLAAQIKGAVLGLYGSADQGIPMDDVEAMKDALAKAGSKSQLHVYEGAHARLSCRLPPYLSQGCGGRRLEAPAGLAAPERGVSVAPTREPRVPKFSARKLVIFGASNIVSDLFDCALANGLVPAKVVLHLPESAGERDIPLATRVAALQGFVRRAGD
jgi:hypothetical protein